MVEVRRREHETIGAMLRRFTRRVQQSGVLMQVRKKRFYKSAPTRRAIRAGALRRTEVTRERIKLQKLGKLNEEERRK
ncbi:MAG: 30S ribosomal protein S21 [bacterium]|nr:30S ribosomal protein S21 [bacterium]